MIVFPTPLIATLAQASKKRFHTAMLEGSTEQAAFEEIVRIILECYVEARKVPNSPALENATPRTDALLQRKPGMWRQWKDVDFHELELLTKQLERELAILQARRIACPFCNPVSVNNAAEQPHWQDPMP